MTPADLNHKKPAELDQSYLEMYLDSYHDSLNRMNKSKLHFKQIQSNLNLKQHQIDILNQDQVEQDDEDEDEDDEEEEEEENKSNSKENKLNLILIDQIEQERIIDLEFHRLISEEQCAPSTPISSNSNSNLNHSNSLDSTLDFPQSFLSIDPFNSLFQNQNLNLNLNSNLNQLNDLGDLINSNFDLYSHHLSPPTHQSISLNDLSSFHFNSLLSDSSHFIKSNSISNSNLVSQIKNSNHFIHHPFELPLNSNSSLPPPNSSLPPPISIPYTNTNKTPESTTTTITLSQSNHPKSNSQIHLDHPSQPYKTNTTTTELPSQVELSIPKLIHLNLSEPYPNDLQLFLIGLRAQGAKTRVETQIKVTLVLAKGQGGSIDRNGNLSTETQHTLNRIGNWSHIKLPVYSAIKRKSKKLIKTGIPLEETLFLNVSVLRASEPHDEIFCCSNCQLREEKRTQRKRDARVRPAQEIESDEAEQSIRPEDEKRKIVVFNCGQYVNFESGEVTLPTRITCYCRHHREKKGFRVKFTLRDHTNRLIATSITPAIMITDDHKAVAAAAKVKSGSDLDDNHSNGRIIRKLPDTTLHTIQSIPRRSKKKSTCAFNESKNQHQIVMESDRDKVQFDSNSSLATSQQNVVPTTFQPSPSQSRVRSISTSCKRKAHDEINSRANIGRKLSSNQSAPSTQINELVNDVSTAQNTNLNENDHQMDYLTRPSSLQSSRPQSPNCNHHLSIPISSSITHLQSVNPAYLWHQGPSFPKQQSWQEIPTSHNLNSNITIETDMKGSNQLLQKIDQECLDIHPIFSSSSSSSSSSHLNVSHVEKCIDFSSSLPPPLHVTTMSDISQNCELPNLDTQVKLTNQKYQQDVSQTTSSCLTISSPDPVNLFPCGSLISTSPTSGSFVTSPKSSIDSRQYNQFKCSNPTSPSSSIFCTQTRSSSHSSSHHTNEFNHRLPVLPFQCDSPLEQLLGDPEDQTELYSHTLNDISCSTPNEKTVTTLDNVLVDWNVLSLTSQDLDPRPSPQLVTTVNSPQSQQDSNHLNSVKTCIEGSERPQFQLSKLVPNEGPIEGGVEIIILGSHFRPGLMVHFASCGMVQTEFWSTNTLVCKLPPSSSSGPCKVSLVEDGDFKKSQDKEIPGQIFTYVDQADQKLMELALQVVGLKMTGQVQDPKNFARKIIVETRQFEKHDSLNHTLDLTNEIDFDNDKNLLMSLKILKQHQDSRKLKNEEQGNLSLLCPDSYAYVEQKFNHSNTINLTEIFWILSILVIAGVYYSFFILMKISTQHKPLKQEISIKFFKPFCIQCYSKLT